MVRVKYNGIDVHMEMTSALDYRIIIKAMESALSRYEKDQGISKSTTGIVCLADGQCNKISIHY